MRILLIGNFSPPYEEENLHNFTLLNQLNREGHKCSVININESSRNRIVKITENEEIINVKNYLDFVIKLIRYGYRRDVMHFLTKGYTRPGLMKLLTTVIIGKLLLARIIITLHPELFSIFGRLRSKMGGQLLLHLSFSLSNKIICGDIHTYEVATMHYETHEKFVIIPSFIHIPVNTEEDELSFFKKLENKKMVIVFSNVSYPSLLFEILNNLLTKYLDSDAGIAVSLLSEENSEKLQHIIEDAGNRSADNMVFIKSDDKRLLSMVYAKANLVLRTLSCDGKILFEDIALSLKKPVRSENYLYFPVSFSLIKEGEVADLCAYIFNELLMEGTEKLPESKAEDFYSKIKEIYSE